MKRLLRLYPKYISMAFKSRLAYRADALVGIFGFIVSNTASFLFIYFALAPVQTVGGWTVAMIMTLYGMLLLPKGIDHLFSDNLWQLGMQMVVTGNLDKHLVYPVSPLFSIVASTFQYEGFGEIILGTVFLCIFAPQCNIIPTVHNVIPLIICLICAVFIFFSIKLITASLAFFMKRSISVMNNMYSFNEYARYPIKIFGNVFGNILLWVIPFGLTVSLPVSMFLGEDMNFLGNNMWLLALIAFGVTFAFVLISVLFFRFGLKKYESAGS